MMWLLLTVLGSSLLGSLHCAGMCGPLAALSAGCRTPNTPGLSLRLRVIPAAGNLVGYNLGRLLVYGCLGAIAGAIGAMIDIGGALIGAQRAAATIAGAIMLACGCIALLRLIGVSVAMPETAQQIFNRLRPRDMLAHRQPHIRAIALGLLSGLLPCGWLYAFVLLAAGSGDPLTGAAIMAAFWVGTLPILLALGAGAHALLGSLRPHMPILVSLALIAIGLLTVLGRIELADVVQRVRSYPHENQDIAAAAKSLTSAEMPCCHAEEPRP